VRLAESAGTPVDLLAVMQVLALEIAARDPETGAAFTPPQLRDQVATMIVAGHETTALTLFWSLYLLANARAEQELLAAEASGIDLAPDVAAEAKLPYTRAVVNETLRLYPPVFAIVRMANAADRIGDLEIAAGSVVIVAPWVLHRHTKFWNNAEAFDPARFQAGDPPAHRFAYLPFGAGPRVCIGAQFALTEASLVLARLAQRFEFALAEDAPVLPLAIVTTQPNRPALFRLRAR
jgi:cytochrome P450